MSTNAIDANYKPAYYVQAQNIVSSSENKEEEASIYSTQTQDSAPVDMDYICTDGKDDGKLGTGEVIESVGKGIFKSAINMVKMPFTEAAKGNFLPAIAVVAGAALCATPIGAPLAVIGGAIGIAKGASDIVGGIAKANEIANSGEGTDGEAKAALEEVGSGILTTGLSAVAVAGGVKAIKGRGGELAKLEKGAKFGDKVKAFKDDTITAGKDTFGKLTSKAKTSSTRPAVYTLDDATFNAQVEKIMKTESPQGKVDEIINKTQAEQSAAPATNTGSTTQTATDIPEGAAPNPTSKPSKTDVKAEVRKIQPTNKNLTVEQAQTALDDAKELMMDRSNTRADYKAAKSLVEEAQANYDYAANKATRRANLETSAAARTKAATTKQPETQASIGNPETSTVKIYRGKEIDISGKSELPKSDVRSLKRWDKGHGTSFLQQYIDNYTSVNGTAPTKL